MKDRTGLTRPFPVLVLSPDAVGGHGWARGTESTRLVEVHIYIVSPRPLPLNEVVGYIKFKPEIVSSQSGLSSFRGSKVLVALHCDICSSVKSHYKWRAG